MSDTDPRPTYVVESIAAPPATAPQSRVDLAAHARAARERAIRNAAGLSELLAERPELYGVTSPAIWAHDSIRWSA
jgi:hypothetical protein